MTPFSSVNTGLERELTAPDHCQQLSGASREIQDLFLIGNLPSANSYAIQQGFDLWEDDQYQRRLAVPSFTGSRRIL